MKYLLDYRVWLFTTFIISFIGAIVFASQFWAVVLILECFIMAFWSFNKAEYLKK